MDFWVGLPNHLGHTSQVRGFGSDYRCLFVSDVSVEGLLSRYGYKFYFNHSPDMSLVLASAVFLE
jgi:hypothetical protein